jgi:phosphoribosylformimino-5-aminoimidazole carboxamide ribotide isomerase
MPGANIILDAGISDVESAQRWLELKVGKVVVGSDTLCTLGAVGDIPAAIESDRIVFSLDLRARKILSRCPEFAAMTPIKALEALQNNGWQEVILLDLERVGSGEGMDAALVAEAKKEFPGLRLLIGGGITGTAELRDLESAGVAGVLIATAFHQGLIGARHIRDSRQKNRALESESAENFGCPGV